MEVTRGDILREHDAGMIYPFLLRESLPRNAQVYLPDDVAIEYVAEYLDIPIEFILASPIFKKMFRYGIDPVGFPTGFDELGRNTIDGLSILYSFLAKGKMYHIIDGILGRPGDLESLQATYLPVPPGEVLQTWLNLPNDIFINTIVAYEIRGKELLTLCIANADLSAKCNGQNQELFRIILRDDLGITGVRNPREVYRDIVKTRLWACGTRFFGLEPLINPEIISKIYGILQIACGSGHQALIDIKGRVWTMGQGNNGELGHGTTQNRKFFKMIETPRIFTKIRKIACGNSHTAFLDAQGQIWTFGDNILGQLGHGDMNDRLIPTMIPRFQGLKDLSCGNDRTVFLDAEGRIWTFGAGAHGALGHGNANAIHTPQMISNPQEFRNVRSISCGPENIAFLDERGSAWITGNGVFYGTTDILVPRQFPGPEGMQISCSNRFAMYIDIEGRLWKIGDAGRLENGIRDRAFRFENFVNIRQISCGPDHTAFIDALGQLWTFGSNADNQLGYVIRSMISKSPKMVPNIRNVKQVACGRTITTFIM
jgi:alpha-tubulin suppressor-like RCC1 family protein